MRSRLTRGFGVALTLLLVLNAAAAEFRTPGIAPLDLHTRLGTPEAPLVVDVRAPVQYRFGHIPGAINIPHDEIRKRWREVDARNGVVLYCSNGSRTRIVEKILLKKGVPNLFHLEGTFAAWELEDLPVDKDLPK